LLESKAKNTCQIKINSGSVNRKSIAFERKENINKKTKNFKNKDKLQKIYIMLINIG